MHQLDAYAKQTSLRIEKMRPYEMPYPLPFEGKYVLFVSSTGNACRNYPHFGLVKEMVKGPLNQAGYFLLQTGGNSDERIGADVDICGKTSIYHLAWLVKNASLVVCGDTSVLHLAGHYNVPFVTLFSISAPETSGAYFGDRENQTYIFPEDFKPTYCLNEDNSKLWSIKPEVVARAILSKFELEEKLPQSLFLGEYYKNSVIESIPNCLVPAEIAKDLVLLVRYDRGGSENLIYHQLQIRKCAVITNKPLNLEYLARLRQNLERIIYIVEENDDVNFVKGLVDNFLPHQVVSFLSNEELAPKREAYVDLPLIDRKDIPSKPDDLEGAKYFRTNRRILSNNKFYLTHAHVRVDSPTAFENPVGEIIDAKDFWEDRESYYIFKS